MKAFFASFALLLATVATTAAAQNTYTAYIDSDNNAPTGCTITLPGGTFVGADWRVQATLTPGTTPTVTSVTLTPCSGGTFGAGTNLGGGSVDLNTGVSGSDSVEFSSPSAGILTGGPQTLTFGFTAQSPTGSDVMFTTNGGPILFGITVPTPALGAGALALLALLIVGITHRFGRTRWYRRVAALSLVAMCGVALAAAFNWTGIPPIATDPAGDATNGSADIDLRAGFVAVQANTIYFRIDVTDLQTQAPQITSTNATTFVVGQAGTFTVTSTGVPSAALALGGCTLPAGVTFLDNGNGTGTLAGTPGPGTANTYSCTLTASNGIPPNATQAFTLTVANAPSQTALLADINPSVFAQTVTFTATVTPAPPGSGTPTGTVNFLDGATNIGSGTLNGSGMATLATGTLAVATHPITAQYAGDVNFGPSTSSVVDQVVNQASQTITFTSTAPAGATVGGATYTVTATASSGLAVALTIDASATSVCSLSGSTVSFIGVGTCVIDANQAGNANYTAAPQVQQSFAVGKGGQAITFTSTVPAGASVGGSTYTVTATASSGLAVTLTIDASAVGVCSITGSTVSFIGVGTCVIDANQAGNANYNAALQVQQSFAVGKGNQTITFASTAPANAVVAGPTYTVTATASSGLPVTFTIDASATSVCSISGATVSFTASGTCVIDANQAGDANYNAAPQAAQSFTVSKNNQTIAFTSTAPATAVVAGATYTVTATSSSGLTVVFSIDATATSVCSIAGSTVSFIGVGTCVIDANQAGNANYNAALQVQQSFAVGKGSQTISFTSTAPVGAAVGGSTYTVTATATSGLPVTLSIDASAASVCSIAGSTVSFIGAGNCVIDANQAGNANYNAAPLVQQSFAVAKGNQTISFTSTAPASAQFNGTPYTVTATATSGLAVTFTIDASAASVCSITGSTVSFIGAGTCVIDANQSGNASYNAAPQAQQSFAVAKDNQTITFTSTPPANATPGVGSYNVTATATSGLAVTFTIDASASSVCSISGSTVLFTADGTCVIDANQSGNANFNAAPQVQQSFVVDTPPTVTSTIPTNGATSVPLTSTISITFSKSVTATGTAFSLACSPGVAPSFTVTPASPATTFVLHPTANLPFDSSCTVTVTHTQVTDAASRTMTADYMFSFSTPPLANNDIYPETLTGNVSINSSTISFSVLTNDQFNSPVTITAFDATSANGGTVSMNTSNGQFTFNPAAGYMGADSFTYTISDAHGSATATVSMTISGMIWFINNTAGAGDGRLSSPFNSLAAFQAVNDGVGRHPAANDNIFLYDSVTGYTGPVTLLNGQKLIGQDATSSLAAISGLTPGTSSATLPATGGGLPNKVSVTSAANTVTLGSGNTVWGMSLGNASGTALTGASVGALKVRDLSINTTGGAVSLANGALDAILNSVSSGGGTNGIAISTTSGSFDIEGDGASDPTNTTKGRTTAKNGGGTLALGSGGTIQNATGAGVLLSSATNITLRNMTIQNNGGAGVNTNADGVNVSNGSALTLDNDLITGQVGNHGVHAMGLAGFTVVHTEISGNATSTNNAIAANGVWNVRFDNLTGTSSVEAGLFENTQVNPFGIYQTGSAAATLSVDNSQFSDTATAAPGNVGLQVQMFNTSSTALTVTNSSFLRNFSTGVEMLINDSGGGSLTVGNSTFDANAIDVNLAHQGKGQTASFNIHDNTMRQTTGGLSNSIAIGLGSLADATTVLQGKIQNNTIGNASVIGSGSMQGNGIVVTPLGAGKIIAAITGNTVVEVSGNDVFNMQPFQYSGRVDLTLTGNTFSVDTTSINSAYGIDIIAGNDNTDSGTICANMTGNKANGNAGTVGSGLDLITGIGNPTVELQGYGGAANDTAAITSYIDGNNTDNPPPATVGVGPPGTIEAAPSNCATPP